MSELPMIKSLPGYPWLQESEATRQNIARIAELEAKMRQSGQDLASVVNDKTRLEAALRPFARLTKVEQARTAVIAEDDLITVVVRVGDIDAARAALSADRAAT